MCKKTTSRVCFFLAAAATFWAILMSIANRLLWNNSTSTFKSVVNRKDLYFEFTEYVSSAWEDEWRQHILTYQEAPCTYLTSDKGADFSETLLTCVKRIKENDTILYKHTDDVVSYFVYRMGWTEVKVFIEPLVGFFRHQYALCVPQGKIQVPGLDLSYMIFRGMPLTVFKSMYPGRKYLFDLGINCPNRSLEWFDRFYHENGIDFDEIWGWDLQPFDPIVFWKYVPRSIYPKLHLINVPVGEDFTHDDHPFQIIKRIVQKGDYVALKIDIDSPGYEQTLADQLLTDTALSEKIGDFYYEKHFGAPDFSYHGLPPHGSAHTMDSVMTFFTALRKLGIRAHYWV